MSILREFHPASCACSICRELRYAAAPSFGFLAPEDKSWNSWRWLFATTKAGRYFLRWNKFWQPLPPVEPEEK